METLFSVLHVVGAIFIVGPMAVIPMSAMRAMRAGEAGAVKSFATSTYVFSLASLLVALFGFGLVSMVGGGALSVTTPWILASIILYVAALALSLFLVVPALRAAAAGLGTEGYSVDSAYRRVAIGSGITAVLLLAVAILMIWKP
jgi:uncharacterized membrane protein